MSEREFGNALLNLEGPLFRFAQSLTHSQEDARDLLQDTFLKALQFKESFAQNSNIKAWTFTIMRNTFINGYRKLSRRNTTHDETESQRLLNSQVSTLRSDSPLEESEMKLAMSRLSDEFRIPFEMHTHGYKYREIADELDLCIGTVKSRIFFSRQKLMEALPGYGGR